jgi:RecA/RadA recombinase
MTVEVIGSYPSITRLMTGFYSLDRAFVNDRGELGVPIGHCWELFGTSGLCKSTFTNSLAGIIASIQKKNIVLCDFEGFDPTSLTRILEGVGFSGKVNMIREAEDEEQVDKMVELLGEKEYCIAILDSVSAISPVGEQQGDTGEANMGRRAFIMAQLSRKALHIFRFADKEPKTMMMVNHWLPKIGSRGYQAPGGEVKSFLATIRISLKRIEEFPDGSYVLQGEVKKNRWGFKDKKFYAFMLVGMGIHKGLTALYDCVIAEKAEYKNGIVKMGGDSLGRMSKFVKGAHDGNNEIFNIFHSALAEDTSVGSEQEQDFTGTTDIADD